MGNSGDVEVWEFESEAESPVNPTTCMSDARELQDCVRPSILKVVGFMCTFLLSWQAVFRIPDGALNVLFKFLSLVIMKLCNVSGSEDLRMLHRHFPSSLVLARMLQSGNDANFSKLIVCQKCYTTYRYEDGLEKDGITSCTYVRFLRHSQKRMRVACKSSLLKVIKTASGKHVFHPLKIIFCYRSIIETLKQLLQRPGMLDVLNKWKTRAVPNGIMADIYDGSVRKSFLTVNGEEFLTSRYTFGLLINVDWFQPYKHVQYSVGAIYTF